MTLINAATHLAAPLNVSRDGDSAITLVTAVNDILMIQSYGRITSKIKTRLTTNVTIGQKRQYFKEQREAHQRNVNFCG